MIEPFFFRNGLLFGCYHPANSSDASRLLVICPPFFDEYKRTYRSLSDLANACAEQGVHVLRFDFFGTGESFGALEQASIMEWQKDIDAAIEEGIALTGAEEVILCGIRFGGTLAAQSRHRMIKRYILWDPIDKGADFLGGLNIGNQNLKQRHQAIARYVNQPFEDIEYVNFRLPKKMIDEMPSVSINQNELDKIAPSFIITTSKSVYDSNPYSNCEFPGLSYDWPAFHEGTIAQKPVLEAIAQRVLEP